MNSMIPRRDFLKAAAALGGTIGLPQWLPAGAAQESPSSRPNILFIMVDEMRWNAMSCAGNPIVKTPNLDRLAQRGTRFATAYTCAPICTPSRYSFFTGRYSHVHGSTDNQTPLREGQILLPAILKHYGYETAISGKLHFIPSNVDYDFDYFWSFANEGPGKLPRWPEDLARKHPELRGRGLVPGSQPYPDDPLGKDLGKLAYPKEDYQTFWITDRALEFLRVRNREKPFFLFVSYLDPHSPSHLPDPYWAMFNPKDMPVPPIPKTIKKERASEIAEGRAPQAGRHLIDNEEMARALTASYYATVKMVDDEVGRLLKQLEAAGLMDNTIIVFTADHGNMLGDLGRWFKGVMHEGSTRIPLMIKAPNTGPFAAQFNRGKVIPEIVENIDVMPTLCEMIGKPLPHQGIQGKSLAGLVSGTETQWKNRAFAERGGMMVRTSQYKLIHNDSRGVRKGEGEYELYDLIKDAAEEHNLIADPNYAKVVGELKTQLNAWQQDMPPLPAIEGVKPSVQTSTTKEERRKERPKKQRRKDLPAKSPKKALKE